MKKTTERILSLLLTLAFLFSCASGISIRVRASENDTEYVDPVNEGESYDDSGANESRNGIFTPASAVIEVTAEDCDWTTVDSFSFLLEAVTEDAPMPESVVATATEDRPTASF